MQISLRNLRSRTSRLTQSLENQVSSPNRRRQRICLILVCSDLCLQVRLDIQYQPVVEDGNVITAQGDAYRLFAVAMARKVGYQCSDHAYFGVGEEWKEEDFVHHLSDAEWKEFEKEFADLIR